MAQKRSREEAFDAADHPPAAKAGRTSPLGEDRHAAAVAKGANLVGVDGKTCAHDVAWPPGIDGPLLPPAARPGPPAKEYSFTLDPFQQTAINCLEAGHSVLVAAHTSAGKTAVAEYAFAMALRDRQRVIYTSPLKALSNQKYRELYEEFQDVGLLTGDVSINPSASCLVMTTEILRSMLYHGSEVVREVQLIVFDEIHYLRDKERGVVWEESILLAPRSARFAFLSATIPNAMEFATWIARTHSSPCHVVYTDYRPTPLQHYLFPAGADGLYMVVDERGAFREDHFQKAMAALSNGAAPSGAKQRDGKRGSAVAGAQDGKGKSDIYRLVRLAMQRNYDPLIVFSFSKRDCESLARQMSELDLSNDAEKKLTEGIFWNAMDTLGEEDRRLPQVSAILPMLKRGIGIHHSGLLPILKEVIEILFQEGLIKALFATETFSTGLNMPAKTVVFTNARKFDGGSFRWISSGEYIQMSGRAGRRGLDDKGVVVLMLDTRMEPAVARDMVKGAPDALSSAYHLGWSQLLNMLRCEGVEPEQLLRASYAQFQLEGALPQLQARAAELQAEADAAPVEDSEQVAAYQDLLDQAAGAAADERAIVNTPRYLLPFLQPGRLIQLLPSASDSGGAVPGGPALLPSPSSAVWGAVINFERAGASEAQQQPADGSGQSKGSGSYIVDVLVNCSASTPGVGPKRRPALLPASQQGAPQVVPCQLEDVAALSSVRIYIARDLRPLEARQAALKAIAEVGRRFPDGLPLLDAESDMAVQDSAYRKAHRRSEAIDGMLQRHRLHGSPGLLGQLQQLRHKRALLAAAATAHKEVKAAQSLIMRDELKARRRVLRRLGYINGEGVVDVKGRVAAEIQSADELVLTELIFNGVFKDLSAEQVVSLVSACVWREQGEQPPRVREEMQAAHRALLQAARRIGKVALECRLTMDVEEYVGSFRADLMDATAAWCRGARFADVLKMCDVFEGSLVRAVRRIEEVLRQLSAAAHAVGDLDLERQFEDARQRIKRDIIFANSLYL